MEDPKLLTVEEAAKCLCVSRATAYNMIASGQIKTLKIGRLRRISQSEIRSFISKRER